MLKDFITYLNAIDDSCSLSENRLKALEKAIEKHFPDLYRDYQLELHELSRQLEGKIQERDGSPLSE